MSHKFKAGDELFFVPSRSGKNRIVTVEKVGRKWVTLVGFVEGRRIAIDDQTMDVEIPNYGSFGRCYLSEQQYNDERALAKLIAEARKFLGLDGGAA